MYIPQSFRVTDAGKLFQFMRDYSFGVLFSDTTSATHVPFLIDEGPGIQGVLRGHMAKANPHWRTIDDTDVLVVFHGPHALIPTGWYQDEQTVPTWNYTAVHVEGRCAVIRDPAELRQLMVDMLTVYDPTSPGLGKLDDPYFQHLLSAIVGFRIDIKAIQGQWKLSQNYSIERQQRVIEGLRANGDPESQAVANLMEQNIK